MRIRTLPLVIPIASLLAPAVAAQQPAMPPHAVAATEGLKAPESIRYSSALDVYFVSSINGPSPAKDNNGFISIIAPDGTLRTEKFIAGGVNGVTLHAPKGLALVGDTLWVTDVDAVRAFNAKTGASVATVDLAGQGALFLNDIVAAPDGSLYITDSGWQVDASGNWGHPGPDRVFRIGTDRTATVVLEGALGAPNGIAWDAKGNRFVIVPFESDTLRTWKPGDRTAPPLTTGPGQMDGVEILDDGRMVVTSWAASSVEVYRDGQRTTLFTQIEGPADIGIDTKRKRLAVPQLTKDRVVFYPLL